MRRKSHQQKFAKKKNERMDDTNLFDIAMNEIKTFHWSHHG